MTAAYQFENNIQIVGKVGEPVHITFHPIGLAVSPLVIAVDSAACGDEVVHQVPVTPAMLTQTMNDQQNSLGFIIRQPPLIIHLQAIAPLELPL